MAANLLRVLDYFNLLPAFFIEGDGMYTSIFVANLGSVGMDPGATTSTRTARSS